LSHESGRTLFDDGRVVADLAHATGELGKSDVSLLSGDDGTVLEFVLLLRDLFDLGFTLVNLSSGVSELFLLGIELGRS
jgi:hypothetical protein